MAMIVTYAALILSEDKDTIVFNAIMIFANNATKNSNKNYSNSTPMN